MAERAVQSEAPFDFAIALFRAHSVTGSEHENLVTAKFQRLHHALTAQIECACVMRWVKVGNSENFQASVPIQKGVKQR